MRPLLGSLLVVACGPPHVFHKDPERGCADITLASAEDVAAAAGCREVESVTIRTGMALDLKPLGRLETIRGALSVGPTVGFSELSLPRLRRAGSIKIIASGDLHGVFLPALETTGSLEIDSNQAITTISAPVLVTIDGPLTITGNASLEVLSVAALIKAGPVDLSRNPKLTLIDAKLPGLVHEPLPEPAAPMPE